MQRLCVLGPRDAAEDDRITVFCGESCLAVALKVCLCEHAAHERTPVSHMFRQFMFDARHVLGTIDAEVGLCGLNNTDFKAVLQCPQLFE